MWGRRADLCADSGWLIDHKGSHGDATELSCCSTERNNQDGDPQPFAMRSSADRHPGDAGGYKSTAISQRSGKVKLSGGTATVSTPWAYGNSLICLTKIGKAGTVGTLNVSSTTTGSFTIRSTSGSDASTVAWMIL